MEDEWETAQARPTKTRNFPAGRDRVAQVIVLRTARRFRLYDYEKCGCWGARGPVSLQPSTTQRPFLS